MNNLTQLPGWQALEKHYQTIANHSMQAWFTEDPKRFSRFSLQCGDILLDFSKNRIVQNTIALLVQLAHETKIAEYIPHLFSDYPLNTTENRPALHTALRNRHCHQLMVNGRNIMPDIHAALLKMQEFTEAVRNGQWRGATGKSIRDIVNIGIGGSHLGPLMVTHALARYATDQLRCHFISNIDGSLLHDVLQKIDPEKTLFIISSKSFTTLETLNNTSMVQQWLRDQLGSLNIAAHFVAVTARPEAAIQFGIPSTQIFPIWDWVGGRYSIWSAIGLPVALMIGMERFYEFLDGAHQLDQHFKNNSFAENIPILLALLGIWYINFFNCHTQAIIPYAHELYFFRDYIQQADMESNGKTISRNNIPVDYATGPVIIGEQGCDSQHSFFQSVHQGSQIVPVDFILVAQGNRFQEQQDVLIASALSQAQALMCGKSQQDALKELLSAGFSEQTAQELAAHKMLSGNRPSNVLFLQKITPATLGALIAIYEHKITVQGLIWNINSFDQWGVELGKQLLPAILSNFKNSLATPLHYDSSTTELIRHYLQSRNST